MPSAPVSTSSVSSPALSATVDPARLTLGPGARTVDLTRGQAALAGTIAGHVAVLANPLAATVHNPLGTPDEAVGMLAVERLGPFVDSNGLHNIIITFPIVTAAPFAFGGAGSPFGVLPILNGPASGTQFTLGAGSVWFETHLMVAGVPVGRFSGFAVSGGTLSASATIALQGGTYVAPAGTTLTMTATLAPPAKGSGTPGGDVTAATIAMPATVTIVFTQAAAQVTALGNSSLTLYGSSVGLTWAGAAAQAITGFPAILVPCTPSVAAFGFSSVASTLFTPSGTAPINAAGWSLPVAVTTVAALGAASGAGSLVLELGGGASLVCTPRTGTAAIGGWLIGVDPSALIAIAGGTGPANLAGYTLWAPSPPATVPSTIEWANPPGFIASLTATAGHELLALTGLAGAFLDRPLAVDGGALPIAGGGTLFLFATATTTTLTISFAAPTPQTETFSIALENALIGVHAPHLVFATGPVATAAATQWTSATVTVLLDALWLLPTLPDPYAASFDAPAIIGRGAIGQMGLVLGWTGGAASTVGFTVAITPTPPSVTGAPGGSILPAAVLTLLDLSTSADLFGVQIEGAQSVLSHAPPPLDTAFVGLNLAISDAAVASFALPQVSWEPMVDASITPPGRIAAQPATDGVPTLVRAPNIAKANTQTLVAVAPTPVLLRTIGNVAAGASFSAQFSLPFGMIANIAQANRPPIAPNPPLFTAEGGAFALVQPSFGAGTGALQLMLKPPNPTRSNTRFGGSTTLSTDGPAPGYGAAVLSTDVATIFIGEFGNNGGVPLLRADLAGYGASIWSEWLDPNAKGTSIIKVHFETVVGRTAYEVVKAQTTLYPHGVRLVRTVTMARQNAGWVNRTDSGWVAATQGVYNFPNAAFPQNLVNRGAVAGVFNVRNIREFETVTAGGFVYRRALFDADVGLDHRVKVTAGGNASALTDAFGAPVTLVPARDLTGYVQISPDENASPPSPNPDPGPADLALLFGLVGPITDPLACMAQIGHTPAAAGTALRCSGISFDMTATPAVTLGAALLSSPVLPRDGAWGFGKRAANAAAPKSLPKGVPVPLVQPQAESSTWHFADIADVLRLASPGAFYGLLQDTGTQKTLFEQPTVKDLTGAAPGSLPAIHLPAGVAPALADLGSLLGATGLFPDLSKAISFLTGAIEQLSTVSQGLFYTKEIDFTGDEDPNTLLDLGVLKIALIYADTSGGQTGSTWNKPTKISFNVDPGHTLPDSNGRNWWLTIGPISLSVTVPEFGSDAILTIIGGFAADDRSKAGLTGLTIDYGSALDTIKTVMSKLQALASFLPGGLGAGLDVSLSGGKLTVRDVFALPTLPLGLGDLSDISLDLGLSITLSPLSADFIIGIGDPDNPFNWVVSPLAGNGCIDVGVKNGKPDFLIQAGIGLGLSIDIGIAEGSASITLAFSLEINGSSLTIMIILNGQASVDVLGGLASASLSLTAAIGISIDPFPPLPSIGGGQLTFPSETITFLASVAVGIHISICWVISISFEGSWSFSQSVSTPALSVDV